MLFKRFFWQTQPILPDMDYNQLKKMYKKVTVKSTNKYQAKIERLTPKTV